MSWREGDELNPEQEERDRTYNLLEAVADIAMNVGAQLASEKITSLEKVEGSRGLISWIIERAKDFEEVYKEVEWGVAEGFGEYIETIDAFTIQALKDRGILKDKED